MRRSIFPLLIGAVLLGSVGLPAAHGQTRLSDTPAGAGQPQATDVKDTEFAVVLTTTAPVSATLLFGASPTALTRVAYDDRDAPARAATTTSVIHRFTLAGLTANTTYYYEPIVGGTALINVGDPTGVFRYATTNFGSRFPPFPSLILGDVRRADSVPPPSNTVLIIARLSTPGSSGSSEPLSVITTSPSVSDPANATYSLDTSPAVSYDPATGVYASYAAAPGTTIVTVNGFADVTSTLASGGPVSVALNAVFAREPLLTFSGSATSPTATTSSVATSPPRVTPAPTVASTARPAATSTVTSLAPTNTPIPTQAASPTLRPTNTPIPTQAGATAPTLTPVVSPTPSATLVSSPTPTRTPLQTASATTPVPTSTPSATSTVAPTATRTAAPTKTAAPTATPVRPSIAVALVSVNGHKPSGHGMPSVSLGSSLTWRLTVRPGRWSGDVTAAFGPTQQDVLDSSPPAGFHGVGLAWPGLALPPGAPRLLQFTTRVRGVAGCGAMVGLTVRIRSVGGAATAQARVACAVHAHPLRPIAAPSATPLATLKVLTTRKAQVTATARTSGASGARITQKVSLLVPVGSFTGTTTVRLGVIAPPLRVALVDTGADSASLGGGLRFQVAARGAHGPITTFSQPITLCLGYAGLTFGGLNPIRLRVGSYDAVTGHLVALQGVNDPAANRECTPLLHDGVYQLTATAPLTRTISAVAAEAAIAAERLFAGQRTDAATHKLAQAVGRAARASVEKRRRVPQKTVAFTLPAPVPTGAGRLLVGLSGPSSGDPVTITLRLPGTPPSQIVGVTDARGLILTVLPSAFKAPTTHHTGHVDGAVRITVSHRDGARETQTMRVSLLIATPARGH